MNRAPRVRMRDDGYIQDEASEWLADLVDARSGMRVADVCAAPGGKATQMAASGAFVVASDVRETRVRTMAAQRRRRSRRTVRVARRRRAAAAVPSATFDRVLVDAPCSGLGRAAPPPGRALARRSPRTSLASPRCSASSSTRPSRSSRLGACSSTACARSPQTRRSASTSTSRARIPSSSRSTRPARRGARTGAVALLLPQDADTDGMFVLRLRRP